MPDTVKITDPITVNDLAQRLNVGIGELMTQLFKSGVMATINDSIDFETAQIMVSELDMDVELVKDEATAKTNAPREARKVSSAQERPPVIAVMGHVDHGKTTLLDAIRGDKVVESEAGGITQHISAYQVQHGKRLMTFLDTPGHEAFSALRQHGAALTDLAIVVVAADDGVKPQTVEAIRFAKQAGVKIMVAINKIDKNDANIPRVLQEISDAGLNPEQWGGDTVIVEVSAKEQKGIDKLLDMVLLVADVEELTADALGPAEGIVIEGHMEKGRGPVATLLVEHGLLKNSDYIAAGKSYGKLKTLQDYKGQPLTEAGSSTPAVVTGFKNLPDFGAIFTVYNNEKSARMAAQQYDEGSAHKLMASTGKELLAQIHKDRVAKTLPIIIKADVKGSVASVMESLQVIGNQEVGVNFISSGVGHITESDVATASAGGGLIYGFSVDVPPAVKRLASREGVVIRVFDVIYELIDDVKLELEALLAPEVVEHSIGRLIIKGIFKITKNDLICGGEVTKGKITPGILARVSRDKEVLGEAEVLTVQKSQQDVKEVTEGDMCGLHLKTESKLNAEVGDRIELFQVETVKRKISSK